jgi:hypothetical protein
MTPPTSDYSRLSPATPAQSAREPSEIGTSAPEVMTNPVASVRPSDPLYMRRARPKGPEYFSLFKTSSSIRLFSTNGSRGLGAA